MVLVINVCCMQYTNIQHYILSLTIAMLIMPLKLLRGARGMQPQYYVVTGVIGALTKSAASPTVNWWQQKSAYAFMPCKPQAN